jgi:hypothetical protein
MGIKLRLSSKDNKGNETGSFSGGLLSSVSGKIILKTPFGKREILPDGSIKNDKPKVAAAIVVEAEVDQTKTNKPKTTKQKKGESK